MATNYQNVAGVEPHPNIPGASIVRFRDGTFLPAPTSLASKFDPRLSAAGATAQNAPLMSDPGPMASVMPDQARPAPAPSVSDVGPLRSPPLANPQQPPPPPTFAVQAPPQREQGPLVDRTTGLDPAMLEMVNRRVYVPGRAGYDPERDNASRRAVRESQTEQRGGVQAWDDEAQLNNVINQRQAIQAKADADNLAAQSALQAQRMYAADLQDEARTAAAAQRAEEERWKLEQTRLSDDARAVASEEVNPNRVFSAAGPFQMLGLAVAAGLKGWVSKGADTSVLDTVQRIIDRDVSIQEGQIARKKGEIDNALARNMQRYGSIEAGRAATKAQQLQAALARFDANKARIGLPAQTAQIDAQRQALEAAVYNEYEQAKMLSQGTTSTATASSMRSPQAATGGYFRDKSLSEKLGEISALQGVSGRGADIVGKNLANEGKDVENQFARERGGTPEQLAAKEKDMASQVATYGQRRTDTEAAQAKLDRFLAENGIAEDKSGNLKPPSDIAGFGRIGQHAPGLLTSQQGINNRAAIQGIVYDSVKSAFGAANDKQVEMIADKIIGNGTPEHITAQLNQLRQELRATRDNLSGSFSPEVVSQYEQNKKTQRSKTDEKTKYFKPVKLDGNK